MIRHGFSLRSGDTSDKAFSVTFGEKGVHGAYVLRPFPSPFAKKGLHVAYLPDLLQRVFAVDVLACPNCGGRMRVIATIDDLRVVRRILTHLGLLGDAGPPGPPGRRAP